MSLPNGSASGADRMIACAASVVLPQSHRGGADADRGNSLHRFTRRVLAGERVDVAIKDVDKTDHETARRIDWHKLGSDLHDVRYEVAYAINPVARSARELGVLIDRRYDRYDIQPDELPGSDDIEGTRLDDVPVIMDLKFGFDEVTEAEHNAQLLTFACAKMWLETPDRIVNITDRVEGRIARVRVNGEVDIDSYEYELLDVEAFGDKLEDAHRRVRAARQAYVTGGAPDVHPGSHCRYCNAMPSCPEYARLARAMHTDLPELDRVAAQLEELSADQAGAVYQKAKRYEALLERVLDAIRERVRGGETLPTVDGKGLKLVDGTRTHLDQSAALQLLRDMGAQESTIAGLYRTSPAPSVREVRLYPKERLLRKRQRVA